ncbi:MAG: type II toxin-antitoxin system CcdA family antitoxin [Burkholderiaceae bacterium]|nr:type II toxin-antitoxin system CcdA family antitoxin [Burkholderiaceae bacterium]
MATHRRPTNITLAVDVVADAKRLGINISRACEDSLRSLIREEKARRWKIEHAAFIAEYNRVVASEGLPLDEWRSF